MKKLLCLLLSIGILLSFSSCNILTEAMRSLYTGVLTDPVQEGYFPDNLKRSDTPYEELAAKTYELGRFSQCVSAVAAFAEQEGTKEEFSTAADALYEELRSVYEEVQLAQISYSRDPENAAEKYKTAWTLYNDSWDQAMTAFSKVAQSAQKTLMTDYFYENEISYFASWEEGTEDELLSEELSLQMEYDRLTLEETFDRTAAAELYAKLISVRNRISAAYGYESYASYAYEQLYARNYLPEDAQAVWSTVKKQFVPLLERSYGRLSSETENITSSEEELLAALETVVPKISSELSEALTYLQTYRLYDLEPLDTKADIWYTDYLYASREPFLFGSPCGDYFDYSSVFHEFGHFANKYFSVSDLLFGIPDFDLSELQSQGMEVFLAYYAGEVFGTANGSAVREEILCDLLYAVVTGAMYDEFQQKAYALTELTVEKLDALFYEIAESYGVTDEDYTQLPHNYSDPFYYLSYSVSAVSALELFTLLQTSLTDGTELYLKVEAMDCEQYYFSDALAEAGFSDVFSEAGLSSVAEALSGYYQ